MARNLKSWLLSLAIVHAVSLLSEAKTVSVSVTSVNLIEPSSSTAVWNTSLQYAHPPLEVADWNDGGADTDSNISVGDGAHGDFVLSRYSQFSTNGDLAGNVITIDTNNYPVLKVKSFHLEPGWTIRTTGNGHFEVQSLSTILIEGTIDCSGADGESITHLDDSFVSQGGVGRCGGGNGGNGASSSVAAESGQNSGNEATGGGGGDPTVGANGGSGGGGGGGHSQVLANPGVDPSAGGGEGSAGSSTITPDNAFVVFGGGAGGGGGGVYDQADADLSNGGAGGGGGGIVYLTAVGDITIAATGSIVADGGNGGGAAPGSGKGGGGGGGAGGSIRIFSGGEVDLQGPVTALEGAGGTSDGGNGGAGARGRTWITDSTGAGDCFPTGNTDNPQSILFKLGCVKFRLGTFNITTSRFDLDSTLPNLKSATVNSYTPGSSAVGLEYTSSSNGRFSDSPNWSTSLSSASGERFLKFRISISNDGDLDPARFTSLSLLYDAGKKEDFAFTNSCGSKESTDTASTGFFFLPLLLLLFLRLYQRRNT